MKNVDILKINKDYNNWAEKQFPNSTAISSLIGLKREVDETIGEIENWDRNKDMLGLDVLLSNARIEYADCLMYLIDSARRFGFSLEDLFQALSEKLEINKKRDWKINEDKSYSHIK